MTQIFQFKSATVPLIEYAGDGYLYQITNTGWTLIDIDSIEFGQMLDLVSKVNTSQLYVISRVKLFDALELKLGSELSANSAPAIKGDISNWNGLSYDVVTDGQVKKVIVKDSKHQDIVQYNEISGELSIDLEEVSNGTDVASEDVSLGMFHKINIKGEGITASVDPLDITGDTVLIEVPSPALEFSDNDSIVGSYIKVNVKGDSVSTYEDPMDADQVIVEITGGINLVHDEYTGGWATEYDGTIQNIHIIDSQYADIAQHDNINGLTLNFAGVNNKAGFVCITDVTPTNITDNVSSKMYDDSNIALTDCRSSTANVDVEVLAVTGLQTLKPEVVVNGGLVTLTQHTTENLWKGTISRVLVVGTTPGEYPITATHSEGNSDSAIVYLETPPAVISAAYTGTYPVGGQTSYVGGRTVNFTVTADKEFTHLEVVADADCGLAYKAINPPESIAPFTEYLTRTGNGISVAVATDAVYTKHLKVRVKNANTTNAWSTAFTTIGTTDHTNFIKLDSRLPVATIGTIAYPGTQKALKGTESVTSMPVTYTNVEQIAITSPNGELTVGGTIGGASVTATRIDPGLAYNYTAPNVSILAKRLTNDTQSTSTAVVFTANDAPTITMSVNSGQRLRSGGNNGTSIQSYTVTLSAAPQRLNIAPTVVASGGDLISTPAWTSANNGITWTKTIKISDGDTRGAKTFNTLLATNLAGVTQNVIDTGEDYEIGGFVSRSGTFPATTAYVDIGVAASGFNNANKIIATIGNVACTYAGDTTDVTYVFGENHTITMVSTASPNTSLATGNALRINEADTVGSNSTGGLPYTIEELA